MFPGLLLAALLPLAQRASALQDDPMWCAELSAAIEEADKEFAEFRRTVTREGPQIYEVAFVAGAELSGRPAEELRELERKIREKLPGEFPFVTSMLTFFSVLSKESPYEIHATHERALSDPEIKGIWVEAAVILAGTRAVSGRPYEEVAAVYKRFAYLHNRDSRAAAWLTWAAVISGKPDAELLSEAESFLGGRSRYYQPIAALLAAGAAIADFSTSDMHRLWEYSLQNRPTQIDNETALMIYAAAVSASKIAAVRRSAYLKDKLSNPPALHRDGPTDLAEDVFKIWNAAR